MKLRMGDCLVELAKCANSSVDLVLADLPYGNTALKWDTQIDLGAFWREIWRVLKPNGTVLMFCQQPFTTDLINSARDEFKYPLVWQKSKVGGFVSANYRPLISHEDILVFSRASATPGARNNMYYNPQDVVWKTEKKVRKGSLGIGRDRDSQQGEYQSKGSNYPRSVLFFANEGKTVHPTQKPVELLRYLIRTYCPNGGTVCDPTMGSGSTGVASVAERLHFVGIELDEKYFKIAHQRIAKALDEIDDREDEGGDV